jgi:hypothetical protein
MIKALLMRKLIALGFSAAVTVAIPFAIQDRPRIKWVWDNLGPVVVSTVTESGGE